MSIEGGFVILAWQASVITDTAVITKYDMTYRRCPPQDCLMVVIQVSLIDPGGQILPNARTEYKHKDNEIEALAI